MNGILGNGAVFFFFFPFGAYPGLVNTKEMRQYFCCSHIPYLP